MPSEGRSSPAPVEVRSALSGSAASPYGERGQDRAHRESNDKHHHQRHYERLSVDRHEYGHKQDADREQWQEDKERNRDSPTSWLAAEQSQTAPYDYLR